MSPRPGTHSTRTAPRRSLHTAAKPRATRARQILLIRAEWLLAVDITCQFSRAVMQLLPVEGMQCTGTLTFMITGTQDGVGRPSTRQSVLAHTRGTHAVHTRPTRGHTFAEGLKELPSPLACQRKNAVAIWLLDSATF